MSETFDKRSALAFIVAFGIVSLFADMAYEGMRSVSGPFLGTLGANGTIVGIVAGTGELFGYVLRLFAGRVAERTRAYWPITISGYVLQMAAIPLLAFAGLWWVAAILIVFERTGKAIRNPAANFMMSRAGEHIGQGWAFGLHEVLDQTGALIGPLIVAFVLARHGQYADAFLWMGIPAGLTVLTVLGLYMNFAFAGHIAPAPAHAGGDGLSRAYWLYAASAALIAFGFADWSLIAFHFAQANIMSKPVIPVLYAAAMGGAGAGALVLGRGFDRWGFGVLIPAILVAAIVAPLTFLGTGWVAVLGAIIWGVVLGVENSVLTAGVAHLVPQHARARAYGAFSAIFGVAWFLGSTLLGVLYDVSLGWLAAVSIAAELLALIPLFMVMREV
jgi:predicted MFS family arabinose efflux permease